MSSQPNTAPVAVDDNFPAFNEDTPFSGNVLLNDTDVEDTRPSTAQLITGPANDPNFTLNADGSFNYTPAANFNGSDTFTYIAKDSSGASSGTATVTLTVNPVNDLPIAVNDNYTVSAGGSLNNNVLLNDTDIEDAQPQTAQLISGPASDPNFTLNADGSFTYTPSNGATSDSFTYIAKDSSGASSNTATVNLTVSSQPNTAPVAVDDNFPAFNEDTPFSGNVLLNDTDVEDTRPSTAQLITGPANDPNFTLNADGSFNYTPAANFNGSDTFTYIAKDSSGASSGTATVTLTVNPVNDLPIAVNDNYTVSAGGSLNNNVLLNDTDIEDAQPQTAQLISGPASDPNFTLNADGSFTYTPAMALPATASPTLPRIPVERVRIRQRSTSR
ncbi:Ig-like domain-containing protein [Kovacikia minuta]|uniref:Ig-like domain-containing protein n=1 Tax=Kovacikia minuta TaxID=2931930 RepID=UPI0020C77589|nr:Ig-like domain-containing protein [Kovacikia minuta]